MRDEIDYNDEMYDACKEDDECIIKTIRNFVNLFGHVVGKIFSNFFPVFTFIFFRIATVIIKWIVPITQRYIYREVEIVKITNFRGGIGLD